MLRLVVRLLPLEVVSTFVPLWPTMCSSNGALLLDAMVLHYIHGWLFVSTISYEADYVS